MKKRLFCEKCAWRAIVQFEDAKEIQRKHDELLCPFAELPQKVTIQ